MTPLFKRIVLTLTIIYSFSISFHVYGNSTSTVWQQNYITTYLGVNSFIREIIGAYLVIAGTAHMYDVPLNFLDRIARSLEKEKNDEYNQQQEIGRRITGSLITGLGMLILSEAIYNSYNLVSYLTKQSTN